MQEPGLWIEVPPGDWPIGGSFYLEGTTYTIGEVVRSRKVFISESGIKEELQPTKIRLVVGGDCVLKLFG